MYRNLKEFLGYFTLNNPVLLTVMALQGFFVLLFFQHTLNTLSLLLMALFVEEMLMYNKTFQKNQDK